MILAVVCHIWPLLCWGRFPLGPLSGEFYQKWCLILWKASYASIDMTIWFLFFSLLMWCITLIDLHILKNPGFLRINSTWSWCMILLMNCWIQFANIFWGFLHLSSSLILVCNFLFFLVSLSGFGIRVMVASQNKL